MHEFRFMHVHSCLMSEASSSKDTPNNAKKRSLDEIEPVRNVKTKNDATSRAKCLCVSQDKIHPRCLVHKGADICTHNKRKSQCRECGGSDLCTHNKQKRQCRECGGSDFCTHDKLKSQCRECGGSDLCTHDKLKSQCRECGGSAFCKAHNKRKSQCRECGGRNICTHKKRKEYCKLCGGSALCKTPLCETKAHKKYDGLCLRCCINTRPDIEVPRNYKTKEKTVVDRIIADFRGLSWKFDKTVEGGCSLRRPDVLLDCTSHVLIIEVDENKHDTYECTCENKRIMQISQDLGHRPVVFIRFNPDGYKDHNGLSVPSCWAQNQHGVMTMKPSKKVEWESRIDVLKEQIRYWMNNSTEKIVEIIELFY
jgi:hypothetical protein